MDEFLKGSYAMFLAEKEAMDEKAKAAKAAASSK